MRKLSVKEEKAVSQIAQAVVNCTHRYKNLQVATAMALIGTGFILLTSGVALNRWMLLIDALDDMMGDPDSILFQERQKSLEL